MKIVLIGQAGFGKDCLKALLEQEENVVAVITIPDEPKGRPNPLKDFALEKNIPVFQPPGKSPNRLKDPRLEDIIRELEPDLFVLAFVGDIIPDAIIKIAPGINYHPSLLPKYRGASAINWALINGEKETGVTVHYIDKGVDSGDIILQESVKIAPEDTAASLYFDKLYPLGVRLIAKAVAQIREKRVKPIPQDVSKGSYQPIIGEADVKIDWHKDSQSILRLIRGASPTPGAHSLFRRKKIKFLDGEMDESIEKTQAGKVIEIDKGFTIATGDGAILIKRVQIQGQKKITASQFARENHLKLGEFFD